MVSVERDSMTSGPHRETAQLSVSRAITILQEYKGVSFFVSEEDEEIEKVGLALPVGCRVQELERVVVESITTLLPHRRAINF